MGTGASGSATSLGLRDVWLWLFVSNLFPMWVIVMQNSPLFVAGQVDLIWGLKWPLAAQKQSIAARRHPVNIPALSLPLSARFISQCVVVCVCVCVEPLKSNQPICTQPVCPGVLLFFFLYLFNKARFPDAASKRHVAGCSSGRESRTNWLQQNQHIERTYEGARETSNNIMVCLFVSRAAWQHWGQTIRRQLPLKVGGK